MTNVIAIEKSLLEETKKVSRLYLGESCDVVAISFIRINLIRNVGTNLKTGVRFCLF